MARDDDVGIDGVEIEIVALIGIRAAEVEGADIVAQLGPEISGYAEFGV